MCENEIEEFYLLYKHLRSTRQPNIFARKDINSPFILWLAIEDAVIIILGSVGSFTTLCSGFSIYFATIPADKNDKFWTFQKNFRSLTEMRLTFPKVGSILADIFDVLELLIC